MVYPLDPASVTGLRAVAALAGQDTLPLLGEFLNHTHNTLCHRCLPALAPSDSGSRRLFIPVIYNHLYYYRRENVA